MNGPCPRKKRTPNLLACYPYMPIYCLNSTALGVLYIQEDDWTTRLKKR
jgi:hypothetical protein